MVRPAETIRKDLDKLGEATAALAKEFSHIYATYLTALGHTQRRQVVMATYHLCTQVYPEKFLALSVSDRARLQQDIQNLGRRGQSWLLQLMEPESIDDPTDAPRDRDNLNRLEAALVALTQPEQSPDAAPETSSSEDAESLADIGSSPGQYLPASELDPSTDLESETDDITGSLAPEAESSSSPDIDPKQLIQSVIMAAMASEVEETIGGRPFTGDPLTPTLVAKHHLILERMLREVLQRVSRHTNRMLRKANILPDLPEALIEMAAEADVGIPKGRSAPNVMNVMVAMSGDVAEDFNPPEENESQDNDDDDDENADDDETITANMTQLAAVHLRLSDLEFGDVQAALWRSKLRTSVGRLRQLGKQYQQAERELAIAQAEQAWRSVWHTDADEPSR
jgi:hypothetical protein